MLLNCLYYWENITTTEEILLCEWSLYEWFVKFYLSCISQVVHASKTIVLSCTYSSGMFELNLGEGQIPNISLYISDKSYCHEPMFSIPIEYSGSHSDTWDTFKSKHTFQVKRLTKMVWVEQLKLKDIMKTLFDFVSYLFVVWGTCW